MSVVLFKAELISENMAACYAIEALYSNLAHSMSHIDKRVVKFRLGHVGEHLCRLVESETALFEVTASLPPSGCGNGGRVTISHTLETGYGSVKQATLFIQHCLNNRMFYELVGSAVLLKWVSHSHAELDGLENNSCVTYDFGCSLIAADDIEFMESPESWAESVMGDLDTSPTLCYVKEN